MNIQDLIEKYTYPSPLHDQILFEINTEWENTREALDMECSRGAAPSVMDLIECRLHVLSEQLSARLRILDVDYRKLSALWPEDTPLSGPINLDDVPF